MSNPTVSSEIEKILQKVVYNAVKLSRLYELEAEYVPDYSEALSKLEELIIRERYEEVTGDMANLLMDIRMGADDAIELRKKQLAEQLKALSSQKGDK